MYTDSVYYSDVEPHRYDKNELPPFAFCESVHATGVSPWHIRRVSGPLKLGGGIDSASLCKLVVPPYGWDLSVRITEQHLKNACPACVTEYRVRTGEWRRVRHRPTGNVLTVLDRRDTYTLEVMLHTNECELGPADGPMLRVDDPKGHPGFETWIPEKECEDIS